LTFLQADLRIKEKPFAHPANGTAEAVRKRKWKTDYDNER